MKGDCTYEGLAQAHIQVGDHPRMKGDCTLGGEFMIVAVVGDHPRMKGDCASNVEGALDPKYDAIDALLAGFPAGTVADSSEVAH